jgi:hypothetical protein
VEKVRQCRIVLVSLPSARTAPPPSDVIEAAAFAAALAENALESERKERAVGYLSTLRSTSTTSTTRALALLSQAGPALMAATGATTTTTAARQLPRGLLSQYKAVRLGLLLWGQLPGEHQPGPLAPAGPPQSYLAPLLVFQVWIRI